MFEKEKDKKPDDLPCSEVYEDDCVDPRRYFKKSSPKKDQKKDMRFCAQVAEVLSRLFGGACDDERLWGLVIDSVVPAPDASRLLVTVFPLNEASQSNPDDIKANLSTAQSFLRKEVAGLINHFNPLSIA